MSHITQGGVSFRGTGRVSPAYQVCACAFTGGERQAISKGQRTMMESG